MGSPYPNYSYGGCPTLDFGVVTVDLEGQLACAMLREGSRPPPAVAPDATHQPELFTCVHIGELLAFCKVFFVSGQADREEKDRICKNQLAYSDDLISRNIIQDSFYIENSSLIASELALWEDLSCSAFLPPQPQMIGRKMLVKMPQGNMKLITNWNNMTPPDSATTVFIELDNRDVLDTDKSLKACRELVDSSTPQF